MKKLIVTMAAGLVSMLVQAADSLELNGTELDLNGVSRTVGALVSADPGSRIVNSGAPVTLTVGADDAESAFIGTIGADITLVKVGTGTIDLGTTKLDADAVRVEGGVLKVAQTKDVKARYVKFTVLGVNPWRTVNQDSAAEMGYFGLCRDDSELAYPEGTTAVDSDGVTDASMVLTFTHTAATDWYVDHYPESFTIDMKDTVTFNGYRLSGATVSTGRSPYHFTVDVGVEEAGGVAWYRYDEQKSYCTCGYGYDYDLAGNNLGAMYAPRMEPIYPQNPVPVFRADATVTVASGAALELKDVSGRVPGLSGAGTLKLVSSRPVLTGDCTFTGVVDGCGTLALDMENDVASFAFASLAIKVTNESKARSWTFAGTAEKPAYVPELADSEAAPLSVTIRGPIVRRRLPVLVDRFEREIVREPLHGTNVSDGATVSYVTAPTMAKYLRFGALQARGTDGQAMIGELGLVLGGVQQSAPGVKHVFIDWFKTTNYITEVMSDQTATYNRYNNAGKLFDGDPDSYYQQGTEAHSKEIYDSQAAVYAFDGIVPFDEVNVWMPSQSAQGNGAYLLCYWNLETSLDGSTWEQVLPRADNTEALGDWGSTAYNRGNIGTWAFETQVGPALAVSSVATRYEGAFDLHAWLKYLRVQATEIGGRTEPFGTGSFIDIGEFEVHKDGVKVPWPSGTVAYFTDGTKKSAMGAIDATAACPNDSWDGYEDNKAVGGAQAQWSVGDPASVAAGVGFVVELGGEISFDRYKLYCGDNWDGVFRHWTKWTVAASFDGQTYYTVDDADREKNFTPFSRWVAFQWYCTRDVDFASLSDGFEPEEGGKFATDRPLVLGSTASINLVNAAETVGGLSGSGSLVCGGMGTKMTVVSATGSDVFAGSFAGENGTLVVDGGTLKLKKADLKGLKKIVLKNGATLKGNAYFTDSLAFDVEEGSVKGLRDANAGLTIILK